MIVLHQFTRIHELARIIEVEERLGRTDPYRRLGTLVHVLARAPRSGPP